MASTWNPPQGSCLYTPKTVSHSHCTGIRGLQYQVPDEMESPETHPSPVPAALMMGGVFYVGFPWEGVAEANFHFQVLKCYKWVGWRYLELS